MLENVKVIKQYGKSSKQFCEENEAISVLRLDEKNDFTTNKFLYGLFHLSASICDFNQCLADQGAVRRNDHPRLGHSKVGFPSNSNDILT